MDKVTRGQENEVPFPLHVLQQAFFCGQSRGRGWILQCALSSRSVGRGAGYFRGYLELLPMLSSPVPTVWQPREAAAGTQILLAHLTLHGFDHDFITPCPELLKSTLSGSPLQHQQPCPDVNGSRSRCLCSGFAEQHVQLYKHHFQ